MATTTNIEWTEVTWNPVTGCTKISPGCKFCYAERLAKRLKAIGQYKYRNGFKVTLHPQVLNGPFTWKKPKVVFVNSMSDLFHEKVPLGYIRRVFDAMRKSAMHQFQILTKRSKRLLRLSKYLHWSNNIWIGVSVENQKYTWRIDDLIQIPASVRFLSVEPLLGTIDNLNLKGIDWVIVGGESGPKARPMKEEWVINIRDKCMEQNVPFFFKQWGGVNKKKNGRKLENREWNTMPGRNYEIAV